MPCGVAEGRFGEGNGEFEGRIVGHGCDSMRAVIGILISSVFNDSE